MVDYFWVIIYTITNNGKQTFFEYDVWGNLAKATYPDGKVELRNPDKTGNLFETVDRIDRKYSAGGRLEQSIDWNYKYDDEGRLIEKRHRVQVQQAWKYRWNNAGMLEEVVRPDGSTVGFKYDALGRRIEKRLFNRKTRWVWDGNVPLHEWNEVYTKEYTEEKGEFYSMKPSQTTTWLFEEGTFVPNGKLVGEENYSIQSNYLGTPEVMYDAEGKVVWSAELDAYGDVRNLTGERTDCPFRYQGQYEDKETGLYYNRFRYYSAEEGMYLSQDPIGIDGGGRLYGYVHNPNDWLDSYGLAAEFDIGAYGDIKGGDANVGDNLSGHELLQNAWLQHNDNVKRGVGSKSLDNPAIALGENPIHKRIGDLQRRHNLFDKNTLLKQSALENINKNAALTRRGIMEGLIERGMDPKAAKKLATAKTMQLRDQAIAHAKKHGYIKGGCP